VSNIGVKEFATAVGVIGSMLFVGFEIRQNTEAIRGSTLHGIADQSMQLSLEIALNQEWLAAYNRFVLDSVPLTELSQMELSQIGWGLSAATRIMENRFRQQKLGILGEEALGQLGGVTPRFYGSWWFREWWDSNDPAVSWAPDFVEFMERDVLSGSPD
jgi:hypothetical protein